MLPQLLVLLFAGGALAWWSESRDSNAPRWVSLAILLLALIYVLSVVTTIPV